MTQENQWNQAVKNQSGAENPKKQNEQKRIDRGQHSLPYRHTKKVKILTPKPKARQTGRHSDSQIENS